MGETGLQLNNDLSYVIATKGSKLVPSITSGERGETITLIVCCNAEGNFLPPTCILKGRYSKKEYEDGMPPGEQPISDGRQQCFLILCCDASTCKNLLR